MRIERILQTNWSANRCYSSHFEIGICYIFKISLFRYKVNILKQQVSIVIDSSTG